MFCASRPAEQDCRVMGHCTLISAGEYRTVHARLAREREQCCARHSLFSALHCGKPGLPRSSLAPLGTWDGPVAKERPPTRVPHSPEVRLHLVAVNRLDVVHERLWVLEATPDRCVAQPERLARLRGENQRFGRLCTDLEFERGE